MADTKKPKWGPVNFKQIEKRREELGLSKSAMATALGITNSTFHNWQRGTTVPHPAQQDAIKVVLDGLTATGSAGRPSSAKPKRRAGGGIPERTSGGRENVGGGVHPMDQSYSTAHPFFAGAGQTVPDFTGGRDLPPGIASVTAAFISSQKAPSAASVYEFVDGLKKAIKPPEPVKPEPIVAAEPASDETDVPVVETADEPVGASA